MTFHIRTATAVAAFILAVGPPAAQAQQIVHDPRALAQMIEEARTTMDQLRALQTQVEQGRELLDSLNQISDVNALARELGLPEVRTPLPDLDGLRAAADGDLSALGDLADRAEAIRRETRLYEPPAGEVGAAEAFYRDALERAGARTARDLAVGEAIDRSADRRRDGLETLRSALDTAPTARAVMDLDARLAAEQALDTAPTARAVMDLDARLAAEQALIANEQVRLQGLALTHAAEARLEEQRARERAEAARTARMQAYERAFQ